MDNWVSFYVELKWSEKEVFNDFMEKLLKYNVGKYVVGKEVEETSHKETGGEHIHICRSSADILGEELLLDFVVNTAKSSIYGLLKK